eukprot:2229632-Alexandrium_andersonii.AAC.1
MARSRAGCFDVGEPAAKYCHWQQATRYMAGLRERTLHLADRFEMPSIVDYLVRCEKYVGGFAIEMARNHDKVTVWGG